MSRPTDAFDLMVIGSQLRDSEPSEMSEIDPSRRPEAAEGEVTIMRDFRRVLYGLGIASSSLVLITWGWKLIRWLLQ